MFLPTFASFRRVELPCYFTIIAFWMKYHVMVSHFVSPTCSMQGFRYCILWLHEMDFQLLAILLAGIRGIAYYRDRSTMSDVIRLRLRRWSLLCNTHSPKGRKSVDENIEMKLLIEKSVRLSEMCGTREHPSLSLYYNQRNLNTTVVYGSSDSITYLNMQ